MSQRKKSGSIPYGRRKVCQSCYFLCIFLVRFNTFAQTLIVALNYCFFA